MTDEVKKEFLDNVKAVFNKHFPNSKVDTWGDWGVYNIRFCLAKDESEVMNQIMYNDCIYTMWSIDFVSDDKIEMELVSGGRVLRKTDVEKNPEERFFAYGHEKLGFRKINGNPQQFLKKLEKFIVEKMCKVILNNAELINNGIVNNLFDVRDKITI